MLRSLARAARRPVLALRSFSGDAAAPGTDNNKRFVDRLVHSALLGTTLYCAYELGRVVLDVPEPLELMVQRAQANNEVLVIFGGKLTPASFLWSGSVRESSASASIPLYGPSGRQGVLQGQAVKDAAGKWTLLNCELHLRKRAEEGGATPYKTDGAVAHPYDGDVEAVWDLLGGGGGRLERAQIHTDSWGGRKPTGQQAK